MVTIDRVQTGVRIERRILKTAKGLAEALDIPLGELLEGVLLHSFEGTTPFSEATIHKIESLKSVYDLDLTSADAHHLDEPPADDELEDFYAGRIHTPGFVHRDHLRMAFLALSRDPFPVAFARYSEGIRQLAVHAGRPEKFNQTITGAFLSLIAERLAAHPPKQPYPDFEAFADANPDLLDSALLERYYTPQRLASPQAKTVYLLPDRPR
jgi:hypothetical protein